MADKNAPSFTKLIPKSSLPGAAGFLSIPSKFYRLHSSQLQGETILQRSDGVGWTIEIREAKHHAVFGSGWASFCRSNCIEEGDAIQFLLVSNHRLQFELFGKEGCAKLSSTEDEDANESCSKRIDRIKSCCVKPISRKLEKQEVWKEDGPIKLDRINFCCVKPASRKHKAVKEKGSKRQKSRPCSV